MKVIVKKENELKCTSYKAVKEFKRKGILMLLFILKYRILGCEVSLLDD